MKPISKNKKTAEVIFSDRVLMSLATDVDNLHETAERIRVQMAAILAERGIRAV